MKNKLIFYILTALIIFSFSLSVFRNISHYTTPLNMNALKNLYENSQYAELPENRKKIMQDEDLYAYAGWHYLTTGKLDRVNIEHPPLGKYLIGLSVLIFNNQNIGQIFWGVLAITLLYFLSKKYLRSPSLNLVVVLLLTQEKLFKEQITHSLLDIILLVFLLMFLLLLTNKKQADKKAIPQGIVLGTIASIKYPSIAAVIFAVWLVFKFINKKNLQQLIKNTVVLTVTAGTVFLLTYIPFFIKNPNPLNFIRLQEKALRIHLSYVPEYPKFQVFNVLLFDRWLSWWGEKDFIETGYWNIFWPIATIVFLASLIKPKKLLPIKLCSLFYLLFLSSRLFFPRYLFLLLPFLYLNLCYTLQGIYKYIK
jgi:predicted membrane-bound dolichyl-phosphate-mannose-protein mannosyltransferase